MGWTYIRTTDGDAALCGECGAVLSRISGFWPPGPWVWSKIVSVWACPSLETRCLTIESEERETWTAEVLADALRGVKETL
jgi:hypothetical protein